MSSTTALPPAQWMAVWLPRLPTDRLRRLGEPVRSQGPADGSPLALYAKVGNAFALTSVDAQAAALGLRPGMPLADARAMQPGLATRVAEDAADAALLDRVAGWCERYTPIVAVDPPHGLFLDVTGCPHLFGGPEALRAEIVQRLKAQGLGARAAIAPTPGAAWALARHGVPGVVDQGKLLAALAPLPVAALRLSVAAAALLKRLGLTRIGQIVQAPRQPFAARAGQDAMRRLDQALGRAPEALSPRHPPPRLFALRRLVEPIQALDAVLAVAEVLCGDLCARLDARGLGAMRLRLVLFGVDDRVRAIDLGFSRAERDPTPMLRVIRERLSAAPEALDAEFGFEAVRLDALETSAPLLQATDLAPSSARNPEAEARVLDRLAARLGEGRVSRLSRRPVHAPERASALLPATGRAPPLPAPPVLEDGVMRRPLRLFPHAKPIDVIASVPDGPPMRFRWRRVLHEVARAEGPERISPHWLRAPDSRARDYYRVEDRAGRRFWMYREGLYAGAEPPRWFLHGLFA